MPEHDLIMNPAAAKFISSLVKSLQILCNGQVEFNECIELVGHINVKVDKIHKFDYIVDEQVSRENNDSSTTFLSNSYHSSPPCKTSQNVSASELSGPQQNDFRDNFEADIPQHSSTLQSSYRPADSKRSQDNVMVKLEGDENDDCMVLPASSEDYESVEADDINAHENLSVAGPSSAIEDSYETEYDTQVKQFSHTGRKRKMHEYGDASSAKVTGEVCTEMLEDGTRNNGILDRHSKKSVLNGNNIENPPILDDSEMEHTELSNGHGQSDINQSVIDLKQHVAHLTSLLDLHMIPRNFGDAGDSGFVSLSHIRNLKRKFLQNMDKDKIKKIKELLRGKRGKRKKQELKSLIAESGISEAQLRSIAQETPIMKKGLSFQREQRKAYKMKTQERQQKLLEMAEMLKRNQQSDSGVPILTKLGNKKVTLHKSSISIVSHQTQILTPDTIDDAVEALTGKKKRQKPSDKSQEQKSDSGHKRQNWKRKMRQIVSKLLRDINESGFRVTFTSTIGSDAGSHSADLSVVPIHVDDVLPEVKDDCKLEMSEEDYAKHLEREQMLEKQKSNEEKMKEMEIRLTHLLTGVEEIIVPSRKRYGPGDSRPTDAERMKQYRRKLKEDPDKYQEYKQKRSMRTRKRRLSLLAAKMKEKASVAVAASMTANPVNEENRAPQSMALPQPVGSVNIHCPQVYGHPSTHQPSVSAVNVHHTGQFVGQVGGIHTGHQHQQPLTYGNEMDIVELIAASHNVQNQHYG